MSNICHLIGAMDAPLPPILQENDWLIAVDGGLEQVEKWGFSPKKIVGDFDSLGKTPEGEAVLQLPCEKDETDMEFSLKLALNAGFSRFLIQGGLGGRLDHSFANLQLLHSLAVGGNRGILLGDQQNLLVISNSTVVFPKNLNSYCSVFALGGQAEGVSLSGLKYEVSQQDFSPFIPLGVSNEFISTKSAKISVENGILAIIWQGIGEFSLYKELLEQL